MTLTKAQETMRPESHSGHIVQARCVDFHSGVCNSTCSCNEFDFHFELDHDISCETLSSDSYEPDTKPDTKPDF